MQSTTLQLYKHQQDLLTLNPKRHLIAFGTGTGKSLSALALADKNNIDCLIIVPKHLVENWRRNIAQYNYTQKHTIITKETFRRDFKKLPAYAGVIVDESHAFFGYTSQMHKSLASYMKAHNVEYRFLLTATPVTATPYSVFACAKLLGYEWNWYSFTNKFFVKIRMGHRFVSQPRKNISDDLIKLIKTMGSLVKMEDCIDVPSQSFETVYFDMLPEQKKAIKELDEPVHIVRFTQMHQIENGSLKSDGYRENRHYDNGKLEYILNLSDEIKKFAVFCRYNLQIDRYAELLQKKGHTIFIIRGDVKNRDEVVQAVEQTEECIVLIQSSCATGYELPSVGVILFASLSFSYLDYSQSVGRFMRINKPKKNIYIHLVKKGGVDEGVYEAISNKKDFYIEMFSTI